MNASEEEFVPEEEAEEGPAALKRLREKLKKAVEEKQEYLDGWQRARADFANFKREEAMMNADRAERIKADLIEELLPVLDTVEMALQHAQTSEMRMVYKQLMSSVARLDVEQIGAEDGEGTLIGKPFDPSVHEALQEVAGPPELEHTIVSVLRSGYKVGNRVIRPAQVAVGIVQE
jgi:molecular chaperone GrpE